MANQTIDTSQQILNRLDDEIALLAELESKVQGSILMLKFLSQRLRDEQDFFTKH